MAQRGINKAIIIGNLGQDPEVRYTTNGGAVCNITVATSESWKDKNTGQQQERTEWHRVVMFRRLAEIAGEYLHKGSKVFIEGRLQNRKWQDRHTGTDRYTTEIVADNMQMLDSAWRETPQQPATTTRHAANSPAQHGRRLMTMTSHSRIHPSPGDIVRTNYTDNRLARGRGMARYRQRPQIIHSGRRRCRPGR